MRRQVSLNNESFDRAGITKDCQEAICEYIWNGFEAGATEVDVSFAGAPLQEAMSVLITDNGKGIAHEMLEYTFDAFLSSQKNNTSIRIKSQSNKGKGRFSYLCFSSAAQWDTAYEKDGRLFEYSISTDATDIKYYSTSELIESNNNHTGTTVEIPLNDAQSISMLSLGNIKQKLLQEFSWFLFLNKSKKLNLRYEGIDVDYSQYIDLDLSFDTTLTINEKHFTIQLIVWSDRIDNSSKIYYLSEIGEICAATNTGFNKNTVDFFHNVFVSSSYITAQNTMFLADKDTLQMRLEPPGASKDVFKALRQEIKNLIDVAFKSFLVRQADKQIANMNKRGSLPVFPDDDYGQLRRRDFEVVTRELYCVEPKIFHKLSDTQEKSLLGFMNLLLASDERENLLSIVEQITNLTTEQRKNFADILQKTKLQYIIEAIGIVERRIEIIQGLRTIVFDMARFANERDHVQKIVEQHFWLFGEQYHLLTADKTLATSLAEYEKITDAQASATDSAMSHGESIQRADIFLYTQRIQEDNSSEMLIIELKAPRVRLSLDVFNQVVRYVNTIRKEVRFNGANRTWKFYAICSKIDDDVRVKYNNFKQHGKLGLVDIVANFEIYALLWDDVFQAFEARHKPLLEKLKLDFSQASVAEESASEIEPSREAVNALTQKILDNKNLVNAE